MRTLRLSLAILLIITGISVGSGVIHLRFIGEPTLYPAPRVVMEQYGVGTSPAGNTTLSWEILIHRESATLRPMGLVVHVGQFRGGNPGPTSVCRDLYYAGYNCASIEYRLVDPGVQMHPPNGDQPVLDKGHWAEQIDDLSTAIIAARTGSTTLTAGRVTGEVFAVGGSAGAAHVADLAAAALHGGDQLDCAVMLSGPYDFHDPTTIATNNCQNANLHTIFANYVNCTPGDPACDDNGGLLDLASPYRKFTALSAPVMFFATNVDPIGPHEYTVLLNKLTAVGATFQSRLITEPPSEGTCTRHAFHYWIPEEGSTDSVSAEAIAFINTYVPAPPP